MRSVIAPLELDRLDPDTTVMDPPVASAVVDPAAKSTAPPDPLVVDPTRIDTLPAVASVVPVRTITCPAAPAVAVPDASQTEPEDPDAVDPVLRTSEPVGPCT